MSKAFGRQLQECRIAAEKTQSAVADALGVTTTYIAQAEAGRAGVLSPEKLTKFVQALAVDEGDAVDLYQLAAEHNGHMRLPMGASQDHDTIAALLAYKWADLTEDQLARIELILDGSSDGLDND